MMIIQGQSFGRTVSRAQGQIRLSGQHDKETSLGRGVVTTRSHAGVNISRLVKGSELHETVPCFQAKVAGVRPPRAPPGKG